MSFCVSLDHFDFMLLSVLLGLVFSVLSQEIGWNVAEMTYFVSCGTLNLAPSMCMV